MCRVKRCQAARPSACMSDSTAAAHFAARRHCHSGGLPVRVLQLEVCQRCSGNASRCSCQRRAAFEFAGVRALHHVARRSLTRWSCLAGSCCAQRAAGSGSGNGSATLSIPAHGRSTADRTVNHSCGRPRSVCQASLEALSCRAHGHAAADGWELANAIPHRPAMQSNACAWIRQASARRQVLACQCHCLWQCQAPMPTANSLPPANGHQARSACLVMCASGLPAAAEGGRSHN